MKPELEKRGFDFSTLEKYMKEPKVRSLYIESGSRYKKQIAFAAAHRLETSDLLKEFGDASIASHIRKNAAGGIGVIGAMFVSNGRSISNVNQILITEILTELMARDFAYVVYNPIDVAGDNPRVIDALKKQGFVNIAESH